MTIQKVEQCPICKGNVFLPYLTCKDFTTSGELFHVEQCSSCQLLITNPRPAQEHAGAYYESSQYISHSNARAGIIDTIYLIVRRLTLRWKYQMVKEFLHDNLILDYGCGTGHFLQYCGRAGVKAYGIEPSQQARSIASNKTVTVSDSLAKLPEIKFNVITLWHVMEHIYDLTSVIQELKGRLTDNGIIFIAVPNWQSPDASKYKELWAAYDVPRHVWHFSKSSMQRLIENSGLKLKKIIPMKLDAYYVSLLSEKNKWGGHLNPISAFNAIATAMKSNMQARKTINHSSLIYLVQK